MKKRQQNLILFTFDLISFHCVHFVPITIQIDRGFLFHKKIPKQDIKHFTRLKIMCVEVYFSIHNFFKDLKKKKTVHWNVFFLYKHYLFKSIKIKSKKIHFVVNKKLKSNKKKKRFSSYFAFMNTDCNFPFSVLFWLNYIYFFTMTCNTLHPRIYIHKALPITYS